MICGPVSREYFCVNSPYRFSKPGHMCAPQGGPPTVVQVGLAALIEEHGAVRPDPQRQPPRVHRRGHTTGGRDLQHRPYVHPTRQTCGESLHQRFNGAIRTEVRDRPAYTDPEESQRIADEWPVTCNE